MFAGLLLTSMKDLSVSTPFPGLMKIKALKFDFVHAYLMKIEAWYFQWDRIYSNNHWGFFLRNNFS